MCVITVFGVAPCQCFSPGANQTTSPGRIGLPAADAGFSNVKVHLGGVVPRTKRLAYTAGAWNRPNAPFRRCAGGEA